MKREDGILLISCYELGHQPFSLASPAARLKSEGYEVEAVDAAIEPIPEDSVRRAGFIGISVPMHTAMRVGMDLSRRIRNLNPDAHLCFYGLYATLNADFLLSQGTDSVVGGEFEQPLCDLVNRLCAEKGTDEDTGTNLTPNTIPPAAPHLIRQKWTVPDRTGLPALKRYAQLDTGMELLPAGYTEATRGCLHTCLHCPITPVYNGRFFTVPADVVLADINQQVRMGARHITFGDPDFLNGPTHALRILRRMHEAHPHLTFDFTTKIEHILQHAAFFSEARDLGGIFVVSAVESVSDLVLRRLVKGHNREDIVRALAILREAALPMRPSLVAFTPWTTLDDYMDLLDFVVVHDLVEHIDPVQYTIRLLVPPGSALLAQADTATWIGALDEAGFTHEWNHPDARMDLLHRRVSRLVEEADASGEERDNLSLFHRIRHLAETAGTAESAEAVEVAGAAERAGAVGRSDAAGTAERAGAVGRSDAAGTAEAPGAVEAAGARVPAARAGENQPPKRRRIPRLTEAWFC